ncbi:MAG: hypothetical protein KatS3mg114_0069 [Planctomycetaceae bacterium]|nr:MAG: hypothetical protein KatS3mg114_0069 [Planctomycetaceae bacterium]
MMGWCHPKRPWIPAAPPWLCLVLALTLGFAGCVQSGGRYLQQSQLVAQQLYWQNRQLQEHNQQLQGMLAQQQDLQQQNETLKANLELAEERLRNYATGTQRLEETLKAQLTAIRLRPWKPEDQPQLEKLTREWSQRYPHFEFDLLTGVTKLQEDLLFDICSAELTPRSRTLLAEFAELLNQTENQRLRILIVGHADPAELQHLPKPGIPTAWHLSTLRANAAVLDLIRHGIQTTRLGVSGYAEAHPLTTQDLSAAHQRNRRVEIYVLAPETNIAGWQDFQIPLK